LGGAPFEIKAMTRRSQLRYFQISLRRFGRPARIDQCLCESPLEIDEFSVAGRR